LKYDKICCMLPTFGRSGTYLPEFISSAMRCSSPDRVNFAFCVNEKDRATRSFIQRFNFGKFQHDIVLEAYPSPNLAAYFNLLYLQSPLANKPGTIVSMLGDDMVFETQGWDEEILKWVNERDGIGVYWCNDMFEAQGRCPVNMFVTREMVALTEAPFMAPEFPAEMIDVVWYWVGKMTRSLHYFPNLVIRHNHNRRKVGIHWDPTFNRLREVQVKVHASGGKAKAIALGKEIGMRMLKKGIVGDSDC
jgi:hypothetical protein